MKDLPRGVIPAILVAALGYFVDIFDLLLFSIVRIPSLTSLGLSGDELLDKGVLLLNVQMIGMLVGGVIWGMLGDKRGRLSVLFGSIVVYSVANIANSFVQSVEAYAVWRFIAGFGLAGELGAGITLVCESLPKQYRGWGTTIVATVGVAGAVVAALVGDYFDWRTSYQIGGVLGLLLLLLRVGVYESGLYANLKKQDEISKGSFFKLFQNRERLKRYLSCIFCGTSVWFVVGVLITFAPEFGRAFNMMIIPSAGAAVMWCYIGLVIGDFASGALSQFVKSRKRVILWFLSLTALGVFLYLSQHTPSLVEFYAMCTFLGFASGFWAVFVTTASEQFGTNLRATVTTTVPNFVRASVVPITWAFQSLKDTVGILSAAGLVGAGALVVCLVSLYGLKESFHMDLDFIEE